MKRRAFFESLIAFLIPIPKKHNENEFGETFEYLSKPWPTPESFRFGEGSLKEYRMNLFEFEKGIAKIPNEFSFNEKTGEIEAIGWNHIQAFQES